ncbi:sigma-70 family RNA polymerase sigma factor [Dehalogenimonas sp. 4OHTPN]|uniref:Sigma-70 family RNA polymerase sigma factor n=1 Tax=Dehalogenimonas sp. 4OHTPN TaxID=3166643 RepID=A0AAU8G8X2_9CHLR
MNIEEEKSLVELAKTDAAAFGALYDEYYRKIFGYALRRTANLQHAQDVTSEVFFKALKSINSFHWRKIPFSAWLYRIASNEVANCFRRNSHYQSSLIPDVAIVDDLSVKDEFQRCDDFLLVHQYVMKLPQKYQEVIALRYFEDKTIEDIAAILGKPENTVKSLLRRGLGKLREVLT